MWNSPFLRIYENNVHILREQKSKSIDNLSQIVFYILSVRLKVTVKRFLKELKAVGLILRVRQRVGKPNCIYTLLSKKGAAVMNEKLEKLDRKLSNGKAILRRR